MDLNDNTPVLLGGTPTMSSLEIAELTGKRHDHVIRDIRKMLSDLGSPSPQIWGKVPSEGGRPLEVANLPKRESLILVSGYSVELRAKIIDRWEALETGRARPIAANQNAPLVGREARLQFRMGLSVAKMLGLSGNQAALSANSLALKTTGVDVLGSMGQHHLIAPQQEALLTPSDIGKELGNRSAISINEILQRIGFQIGRRDRKNRAYWEPTPKGINAGAVMTDVPRSNGTGNSRQLRWASRIVATLRDYLKGEAA